MAKKKAAPKKRTASGRLPTPAASEQSADFNAFLKAADIGNIGATAKLLLTGEVRGPQEGSFGEEIVVEVKHGRGVFDWSVKTDSVNYRMMFERFGANVAKWRGKSVPVIVKMSRQNNPYIAVERV